MILHSWFPRSLVGLTAYASFDAVLIDHAHCEKKAAASSMSFIAGNPDKDILVKRCAKLAQEELKHFQQVHRILLKRGVSLTPDKGDRYVKVLSKHVRPGAKRLTDRLVLLPSSRRVLMSDSPSWQVSLRIRSFNASMNGSRSPRLATLPSLLSWHSSIMSRTMSMLVCSLCWREKLSLSHHCRMHL